MLTTPIPKLIPRMAIPTIAGMLVTSLYNLADTFFVSQLGTYATGAVGVNMAIDNIIMMFGFLLAVGAASFTARLLGAKQDQRATRVLSTCFFLALFLGALIMIFGTAFMKPILYLLGANEAILPYSMQYARYVLIAAPFMASSYVLNQGLRAEGSATYSMIGMVSGAVLNIALDPLFIFVFEWGVTGASAATAISKVVSWIILMTPYLKKRTLMRISIRYFRLNGKDLAEVLSMGSSSFFRNGLATLAAIVLNRIAVGYSESALAAISVANRITFFMTAACLGFAQGFQPVAGFSWGARRFDRVRESYDFSMKVCVLGISLVALLVALIATPLLLLFSKNDPELIRLGVFSLRIQCLAMPIHGYCIIVNMLCAGIGRPIANVLLGLSRQGIFFFPILPLMVWLFNVWGVAAVQGVADILCLILALPTAMRIMKEVNQREATEQISLSCIST